MNRSVARVHAKSRGDGRPLKQVMIAHLAVVLLLGCGPHPTEESAQESRTPERSARSTPPPVSAASEMPDAQRQATLERIITLEEEARIARDDGRDDEAIVLWQELLDLPQLPRLGALYAGVHYETARALARLSRNGDALIAIDLAMRAGYTQQSDPMQDPSFRSLWNTPTFGLAVEGILQNEERLKVYAITEWTNPDRLTANAHRFDDMSSEQSRELRQRVALDDVIGETDNSLAAQHAVLNWVHRRWSHSGLREPSAADANTILSEVDEAGGFRCVEYSIVLAQILNALGHPARVVALRTAGMSFGLGKGHVVAEVWNDELQKWLVLDAQNNLFWTANGEPANAAELQALRASGGADRIEMIHQGSNWLTDAPARDLWLTYFNYVQLTTDNRIFDTDAREPDSLWILLAPGQTPELLFQGTPSGATPTRDRTLLYPILGRVNVALAPGDPAQRLQLTFENEMPSFQHYEVNGAVWRESTWEWELAEGANVLSVRAVNSLGRAGAMSRIALTFYPPLETP